jgi:ABC-type Fe3+ transport system permease subunit
MEYALIIILQLLGIGFHVGQKVHELDKKFENDTLQQVFNQFWNSDRVTVFISGLVLLLNLVVHYIIEEYAAGIRSIENYDLYSFGVALVLGYAGQRLIYKYLGKAEEVLNKKVEEKLTA